MKNKSYVQYGCGFSAPAEWQNFDASPTLRFERIPLFGSLYTRNSERFPNNVDYGDIVKGLPVADASCKGVYCSHILEHLSLQDFRTAIRNTHKILAHGGVFRLVVPDFEFSVKQYLAASENPDAAIHFLKETALGRECRNKGLKGLVLDWIGNSQHLWMWDYKSIQQELSNAGYVNIRRASFGDANDKMFAFVENEGRWTNCLGVECVKE